MSRSNNENMNRMDRVERKLEKLKDKMKNPTRFNHDFSLLNGEPSIPGEQILLLSTLVKFCNRDCDNWSIFVEYKYTSQGIQTKTFVQSMDAKTISFTAEEAIAIAANLANKHLNQSDQDNSENI